jgi:MYXO-CTERM domain-containing protein
LTRARLAAAVAVGALAVTSSSAALETSVKICGPSACGSVDGQSADLGRLVDLARSTSPPPVSAYYELEMKVVGARPQRGYFIPSAGKARWDLPPIRVWIALGPQDVEFLKGLADGPPFDRRTPRRAFVNGREAADPEPYADLLDRFPPAAPGPRPIRVRLEWGKENPWDGAGPLSYSRSAGTLTRAWGTVQLPPALAARLDRDSRATADTRATSDGTSRTLIVVGVVSAGVLVLAALFLAARRRRRRSP